MMAEVAKAPGKHLRWIVWMLIGLPLILLTYLALLATSLFDSRPREYPELALPPRPPGSKTFAEVYGEILARNPQWTPDRERGVYDDARIYVRGSLSDPSSFDTSKIKVFVEEAEKSLGILRELSVYPGPWAREDPEVLAKDFTALVELRLLMDELFLLTMVGNKHGIHSPALPEAAMLSLRVCDAVMPAVSDQVGGLILGYANERALQLADWSMRKPPSAEEQKPLLKDLQELIARCEFDQSMIDATIRGSFAAGLAAKADMQFRSKLWADESDLRLFASVVGGGETPTKLRWQALRTQPNRLIELMARMNLHLLSQSTLPHSQRKPWPAPATPALWSLSPNAGGILLLSQFTGLEGLSNFEHSRARTRLMVVLCAIARHRLDHASAFPSKLEDLVPTYLDGVPRDPFTGDPMAYDPVSAKIWCTGEDGKTDATPVDHSDADPNMIPPGLEAIFSGHGPADQVIDLRKFFGE
jgi:hypothetical protein